MQIILHMIIITIIIIIIIIIFQVNIIVYKSIN